MTKMLTLIITAQDGTFKKTYGKFELGDFSKYINGGLSDLEIKLPLTYDDEDVGTELDMYYDVEVRLSDNDTPSQGIIIYKGYISGMGAYVKGHEEGTTIFVLPYDTLLADDIWEEDYICLDFASGDSDVATVGDQAIHDVTDNLTVECWFNTETVLTTAGLVLHDLSAYKYMLSINNSSKDLEFSVTTASGSKTVIASKADGWNDGNWHYVVGVWEKPYLRIYVDGKLASSIEGYDESITAGDEGLTIGNWSTYYYDGKLMNIRLSDSSRRFDEISMNWKKGQKLEADADAFAVYHCDEGVGATLDDETTNNFDATIATPDWLTAQKSRCTINEEGVDPSQMLKDLVDDYRAKTTNPKINYSASSIDDTSTSKTYRFQSEFFLDAVDVVRGLAPVDWYWHLGADGLMQFHLKPTSATHSFTMGKEFHKLIPLKNMEGIKNCYLFWNAQHSLDGAVIFKRYKDATSIGSYDYHYEKAVDSRYSVEGSVATKADSVITANKNPIVKALLTIIDNNIYEKGYDIDKITPGDTCRIYNLGTTTANFFTDNMTIVAVHYKENLTRAEIEIEAVPRQLAGEHRVAQKRLEGRTERDIPPFYIE